MATPSQLAVGDRSYAIYRLDELQASYDIARLPYTLRVLLENVLRTGDEADVDAVARWDPKAEPSNEISFVPSRVLLQDLTGVPAIVDLAAMRNAMADLGGDPSRINPLIPAELVIDHSVQVDAFASRIAFGRNVELEFERNRERYLFLRWGQDSFSGLKVVPPGTGICHQVNLEYLARVVEDRDGVAFPDTLVGTDSHTTMINGLGVLGWGAGGIEAEAAAAQHVHDHRRGRGLPVGAGHGDAATQRRQLSEQIGAVKLPPGGGLPLGIGRRHGGGVDDLGSRRDVRRGVADRRLDPVLAQPVCIGGLGAIGAGHLGAELAGHQRQPAHPGAAHADEVQPACGPFTGQRGCRSASSRRGRRLGALQHDDRDLALGLGLVLVVGRPLVGHRLPQLGLLLGRRRPRPRREAIAAHLHGHLRVRDQVLVPRRRGRSTSLRRHHQVVAAAAAVDQRRTPRLARAPPGRGQDQRAGSLPIVALGAVCLDIALDVFLTEQHAAPPRILGSIAATRLSNRPIRPTAA